MSPPSIASTAIASLASSVVVVTAVLLMPRRWKQLSRIMRLLYLIIIFFHLRMAITTTSKWESEPTAVHRVAVAAVLVPQSWCQSIIAGEINAGERQAGRNPEKKNVTC